MQRNLSTVVFVIVLAPMMACSGAGDAAFPDDQLDEQSATPGKSDYFNIPFATFRATGSNPKVGDIMVLAESASGFNHREIATSCNGTSCKTREEDPIILWSKAGATDYVRFLDIDGNLIDRYAFELLDSSNTLRLRKVNTQRWQELTMSADVWCHAENEDRQDCTDQSDVKACVGSWTCEDSLCVRHCDYDACSNASGKCVSHGSCGDGTVGDVLTYPCESDHECCFQNLAKPIFDPLDPEQLALAFTAATTAASKKMTNPIMSFLSLQASPVTAGASYAATEFKWGYNFVARSADFSRVEVDVVYPGWTTKVKTGLATGATVSQEDFSTKIKLTFTGLVNQMAADGFTMQTCLVAPGTDNSSFMALKGAMGQGGNIWFWEFFCGDGSLLRLDASSGEQLN